MKQLYTCTFFLLSILSFGQIPANYFNSATGTGYALKTQLKTIISTGHTDQGYGALWTLYTQNAFRDNYYENNGTLLDMYSEKPTGIDSYEYASVSSQCGNYSNEGDCYNREHLIPQSYFDNFQINPMKNDPFHVVPSDGKVNADRGSFPFGEVSLATYSSTNGSEKGANTIDGYSNYSGTVFEPLNEFKGDIARCFFYFATRYEDSMNDFYTAANVSSCPAKNMFDGSNNKVFSDNFILLLIKWHKQDPVSAKEIAQNTAIYNYQGNANPYISRPDFVCSIWPSQCATVNNLSTENFDVFAGVSVYPNPIVDNKLNISTDIILDEINITNINGQLIKVINNPMPIDNIYTIENLRKGFYFLKITANNQSIIKKIIVN